jgi:hypothetical protein
VPFSLPLLGPIRHYASVSGEGGASSDGSFDCGSWKRLIRANEFEQAAAMVAVALREGGSTGVRDLRDCYLGVSGSYGEFLLVDIGEDVADPVAFEAFLWEVFRDPSRPYGHRGTVLQHLADRRVPGVEQLLAEDLRARSEERRLAALHLLALQGTPDSTNAVLGRMRTILKHPSRSSRGDRRLQYEMLYGVIHVFRCADTAQLATASRLLRDGTTNLAGDERMWLREFWPACLDHDPDDVVPEPDVDRVMAWTRGELHIDWVDWIYIPMELCPDVSGDWGVDPPCVVRA